jgi:hypothetical protein
VKGFTAKYGCKILVWYELHATMIDAITREKQIKAGSRAKKLALIESLNPEWKDLYEFIDVIASHRHCEARSDEAIHGSASGDMDCFASLAMTETALT